MSDAITIDFEKAYDHGDAFDLIGIEGHPSIAHQIVIPTEVVLTSYEERPMLKIARVYATNLYLLWDEIRTYDQWFEKLKSSFVSTAYKKLVMAEIWEDCGDDGHVEYRFQGTYRFWIEDELLAAYNAREAVVPRSYRSFFTRCLGEPRGA